MYIYLTTHEQKSQVWTAGQVIGLIHDIPTCQELVTRIEKEAEETLTSKLSLASSSKSKL